MQISRELELSTATLYSAPGIKMFLSILDAVTGTLGLDSPPIVDLDYLRSLPADSFGKAWADHLEQHCLRPFQSGIRLKQIHDGVHVLTDLDTTPIGEAQVQLFLLGTRFRVRHILLFLGLTIAIYRYLRHTGSLHHCWKLPQPLWQAFRDGQQAFFDIDQWHPEQSWQVALTEVRAQLGIRNKKEE